MMMPDFSIADWTNYYLSSWSEQIIFDDEMTLKQKIEIIDKRLSLESKEIGNQAAIKELRKDVYGSLGLRSSPADFQLEALRLELQITNQEWKAMTLEDKAKILAAKSIQSDFETIMKFNSAMESNKKKDMKNVKRKN